MFPFSFSPVCGTISRTFHTVLLFWFFILLVKILITALICLHIKPMASVEKCQNALYSHMMYLLSFAVTFQLQLFTLLFLVFMHTIYQETWKWMSFVSWTFGTPLVTEDLPVEGGKKKNLTSCFIWCSEMQQTGSCHKHILLLYSFLNVIYLFLIYY